MIRLFCFVSATSLVLFLILVEDQEAQGQIVIECGGFVGSPGVTTSTLSGSLRINSTVLIEGGILLDSTERPTLGADIVNFPIVEADVRWVTADWPDDATPGDTSDNWSRWEEAELRNGSETQSFPISSDPANPASPGTWNREVHGDHSRTIAWDLSGLSIDLSGDVDLWLEFSISDTAFPNGGTLWLDGVRLQQIPEPSCQALAVGLTAAAAKARRRRRLLQVSSKPGPPPRLTG